MRKNHEIIKYIFSDKEISKDEKFIFFSILSIINEVNKVSNIDKENIWWNIRSFVEGIYKKTRIAILLYA